MKQVSYLPGPGTARNLRTDNDPLDLVADTLLAHDTLEEALRQLRQCGSAATHDPQHLPGINDLIARLQQLQQRARDDTAADAALMDTLPYSIRPGAGAGAPPETQTTGVARMLHAGSKGAATRTHSRASAADPVRAVDLGSLAAALRRAAWTGDFSACDEDAIAAALGADGLQTFRRIAGLQQALHDRGYLTDTGAKLALSGSGLLRLSTVMLRQLLQGPQPPAESLRTRRPGSEPYPVAGTRAYRFGDRLPIDISRSLLNSLSRAMPLQVHEADLEVHAPEPLMRSATAILIDMSKSMRHEGRYVAAKKVALAMLSLVRTRCIHDRIAIIGFDTHARLIDPAEVPFLSWDETTPYTNMEEALTVGLRVLARFKGYRQRIFLITDGEPTAHWQGDELFSQFPPHPLTLRKTMLAVDALRRRQMGLTIFQLSPRAEHLDFTHAMARRTGGRIFHLRPDDLGQALLRDYARQRLMRIQ